jgi:CheY-like chemotaxis protein
MSEDIKNNRDPYVLLVEDDQINQMIISQIVKGLGVKLKVSGDGLEALEEIKTNQFDLILSDINMPNYDGFELLKQLNDQSSKIPVIFLTGLKDDEFKVKSQEMGAIDFIEKPIDRKVLISKLKKALF